MGKNKNFLTVFNKSDEVLKYSHVCHVISEKELKIYNKSGNKLILDKLNYFGIKGGIEFTDLKTLIIDEKVLFNKRIIVRDCVANNFYINNQANLDNITIPYEFCLKYNIDLQFFWHRNTKPSVNKINIVFSDFVTTISSELIEEIKISVKDNHLLIIIENYNSIIRYKVNEIGEIEEEYELRKINKEDIKNNILDLREFDKYKQIYGNEQLIFDKLVLNKNTIKRIKDVKNLFNKQFNKLEIVDNNNMKLFPINILINLNGKRVESWWNEYHGYLLKVGTEDVSNIIYVDNNDNIILLNDDYLTNNYDMKEAKIVNLYSYGVYDYLIIIKDNKNNYKVLKNEKIYDITESYKQFLLLNKDKYLFVEALNDLYNDNWFEIIGKNKFKNGSFLNIYDDYLKYRNRLKELKKLGLKDIAIKYLVDRKINFIVNTEIENELIDVNDINKFEIDLFNKMGEEYKKIKSLKRK